MNANSQNIQRKTCDMLLPSSTVATALIVLTWKRITYHGAWF